MLVSELYLRRDKGGQTTWGQREIQPHLYRERKICDMFFCTLYPRISSLLVRYGTSTSFTRIVQSERLDPR